LATYPGVFIKPIIEWGIIVNFLARPAADISARAEAPPCTGPDYDPDIVVVLNFLAERQDIEVHLAIDCVEFIGIVECYRCDMGIAIYFIHHMLEFHDGS
jgi:hypothetical protein